MRTVITRSIGFMALCLASVTCADSHTQSHLVQSQAEYKKAASQLNPGDEVVLANGEWRDFEIRFTGQGTEEHPIRLRAETPGKVLITGQSNLRLSGEFLIVSGLVFKDGYTPTSEVISFRTSKDRLANHSRVTEVVLDSFNNPERTETDFWVMMYGKNNRFDHNFLVGKSNNGVTMAVRLDSEESQENNHLIDHNYFGHRPTLGSNGGETLRIGTSKYSLSDSFTRVENNFFERCDGEVEIISSKSGGNVFSGNVFLESRGTLTLRHGNGNRVEGNVFLGNGVDHTGGIRLINKRQVIRNNYMAGLTGSRFGSALTIMNGVPDSPINRYHQVEDSVVENNSIIDSRHIEFAAGSDEERSAVPISTTFANNLIVTREAGNNITVHDDISGIQFADNVQDAAVSPDTPEGFMQRDITLETAENGLRYPTDTALAGVGVSRELKVVERTSTGPDWYPKPDYGSRFGTGKTSRVKAEGDKLIEAVAEASDGDVLELSPGHYLVERILVIDKPLTLRSEGPEETTLTFERTALFEIVEGGALQLQGLTLSGVDAPDRPGNTVVRTSRYSMLAPWQLQMNNVRVQELDVNHSFHFLTTAKSTFAQSIDIIDSSFSDISGHVLLLDRETDDLGLYNVEYIRLVDSSFSNIGQSVATVYRGGTDESTFGPHFLLKNSVLDNVGLDKRNRTQASVAMHGVQRITIAENQFKGSAPIRIHQIVGEPVTRVTGNQFENTEAPVINDGQAVLADNRFSGGEAR